MSDYRFLRPLSNGQAFPSAIVDKDSMEEIRADDQGNMNILDVMKFIEATNQSPSPDVVGDGNYWKRRCEAAEEVITNSIERELVFYHDDNDCDCKFCHACRKWQSIVKEIDNQ